MDNVTIDDMNKTIGGNVTSATSLIDVTTATTSNETSVVRYLSTLTYAFTIDWWWVSMCVFPIIVAMGLVGNCTTAITIVSRRLNTQNAIFVFFLFVSINDLIVNVTCVYEYIVAYYPDFAPPSQLACTVIMYWNLGSMTSTWILVAASLYKLYMLVFPRRASHLRLRGVNLKMATITCVAIMAGMFVMHVHTFWLVTYSILKDKVVDHDGEVIVVYYCYYDIVNYGWMSWVIMIMYGTVPGVILIVTSVLICVIFMRHYRQSLMQGEGSIHIRAITTLKNTKNTVSILLPASLLHIICTLPTTLILILREDITQTPIFFNICYVIINSNHVFNTYIQSVASKKFRDSLFGRE